ncbi:unnamed protein product [Cyprideis torosa]|uniref:glutamine--tRNA ligase n=1 Tax=Cyprideis torosa TaxID=163714 RepID=A0A7R8ZTG7_9CRUS|nr:unnamed protein product [Cyprideis torosa]CAG0897953.1 unnamed protein product [Cyprideis torosa]
MVSGNNNSLQLLLSIGLSEAKAKETLKNAMLSSRLVKAISAARKVTSNLPEKAGPLLYTMCSKIKPQTEGRLEWLAENIAQGKLDNDLRLSTALDLLMSKPNSSVSQEELEESCGVGIVVSPDEIEDTVTAVIEKHRDAILKQRYGFNCGSLLAELRNSLKWADGKAVKNEVDLQMLTLLGPKTEEDLRPKPKKKDQKSKQKATAAAVEEAVGNGSETKEPVVTSMTEYFRARPTMFHAPGENFKTEGYVMTPKTMELLDKHLKETGGNVVTRFPPEPNGILHVGHAKAIAIQFAYAEAHGGRCILRYDDTNPEKEEAVFFEAILEMIHWLGFKPWKVTYSSDYFQNLYDLACELIGRGKAYVCHQKSQDLKGWAEPEQQSPWRNRSLEENLALFRAMKDGCFDEGEATLRMKHTMEEGKVDPVAYRIRYTPHHRTGSQWCIYPTYDFTHCLCDSLENITHSMCSKEFQSRRSSYYWLCNVLDLYCPVQWEYGRLNMDYTVTSKRKVLGLIGAGLVKGWDDPRLYTLPGLRRRGAPPAAVKAFVASLGLTGAQTMVDPLKFDSFVRDELNRSAPRTMVVLDPLKVVLTAVPKEVPETIQVPDFPSDPTCSSNHRIRFGIEIYIERLDFMDVSKPPKDFRRLCVGQPVGLHHAGVVIEVLEVVRDSTGAVDHLRANCALATDDNKPRAFVHWVSDPQRIEVRKYARLFKHANPDDAEGGYLKDADPNSMQVFENGMADRYLQPSQPFSAYQFERVGFFSVDPDSQADHLVFNLTVELKEAPKKKA